MFKTKSSKSDKKDTSIECCRKETNMRRMEVAYQIIDDYAKFLLPRAEAHLKQRIFVHIPIPMFELKQRVSSYFTVTAAVDWNQCNIATSKVDREGCWYIAPLNEPFHLLVKDVGQINLGEPIELAFYFCREDNLSKLISLQTESGFVRRVICGHISKVALEVFGQQKESVLIDHSFAQILKYDVDYYLESTIAASEAEHLKIVDELKEALDFWLQSVNINLITSAATQKVKGKYRVYFKFTSIHK